MNKDLHKINSILFLVMGIIFYLCEIGDAGDVCLVIANIWAATIKE